jgi:hypothetical protein
MRPRAQEAALEQRLRRGGCRCQASHLHTAMPPKPRSPSG